MSLFTTAQIPILHDSPGPWIMHVPVVSTRHLPPSEAEALLRLRPLECRAPDDPPLLAHLLDGVGHLFLIEDLDADEMTTFPHLRGVLLAIKARGYAYARLDADGETFSDLPLFEWCPPTPYHTTMQNIQTMIDQHGGFEAVRTRYLRLENPPFMRLVIEVIGGPYPNGSYELSIAHYSEQNGDAMRDPELTFLVVPSAEGTTWTPLTFENSYLGAYQVVAEVSREGLVKVKQSQWMKELRSFAKQWDRNIKQQGFMEVFELQYGVANGATTEGKVTRQGDGPQGQ